MADRPRPSITLDDESENWLVTLRLENAGAGLRGALDIVVA